MSNSELPAGPVFNLFGHYSTINRLVDHNLRRQSPALADEKRAIVASFAGLMIGAVVQDPQTDFEKLKLIWEANDSRLNSGLFAEAAATALSVLQLVEHQPEYQPNCHAFGSLVSEYHAWRDECLDHDFGAE